MKVWIAYEVEVSLDPEGPLPQRRAVGWFRTEELANEWLEETTIVRRAVEALPHIQRTDPRNLPVAPFVKPPAPPRDKCEDCGRDDVEVADYPTISWIESFTVLCRECRDRRRQ